MTISEVQFKGITGVSSGSFNSDVGANSTLFLWQYAYTTSGATISSSGPTFDGQSGAGPVKLMEKQSSGTNAVYGVLWMLPPPGGGWPSTTGALAVTVTNGTVDSNVGIQIAEFSGMGASASLDSGASPNPETASGTSGSPASGSTGGITSAPELILGIAVGFGFTPTPVGAPWTEDQIGGGEFCIAAYQIVTSSGGAYAYGPGNSGGGWIAGVAAVAPASGGTSHTATAALTVTPSFTATAVKTSRNNTATAALTVTPVFSAARAQGHARSAALTVTPRFSAAASGGAARAGASAALFEDERSGLSKLRMLGGWTV